MFTTYLVNLYNRNIFKTSLYIYIFQDEKCRLMRNLSLSMVYTVNCTRTACIQCTLHCRKLSPDYTAKKNAIAFYGKITISYFTLFGDKDIKWSIANVFVEFQIIKEAAIIIRHRVCDISNCNFFFECFRYDIGAIEFFFAVF